jgi:hypothetical protein
MTTSYVGYAVAPAGSVDPNGPPRRQWPGRPAEVAFEKRVRTQSVMEAICMVVLSRTAS